MFLSEKYIIISSDYLYFGNNTNNRKLYSFAIL